MLVPTSAIGESGTLTYRMNTTLSQHVTVGGEIVLYAGLAASHMYSMYAFSLAPPTQFQAPISALENRLSRTRYL